MPGPHVADETFTGWPDGKIHEAQAAAEGVDLTGHVEFRGKSYRLGRGGDLPFLEFAHAAEGGLGAGDAAGIDAMYEMLRGCFVLAPSCGECEECDAERYEACPARDPGDWPAFRRRALAVHADGEEIMKVVEQAMEQITARPTLPRSGSSSPARPPSANSREPSSLPEGLPAAFRDLPEGDLLPVESFLRSAG